MWVQKANYTAYVKRGNTTAVARPPQGENFHLLCLRCRRSPTRVSVRGRLESGVCWQTIKFTSSTPPTFGAAHEIYEIIGDYVRAHRGVRGT